MTTTSRRPFARSLASTLAAALTVAALASCADDSTAEGADDTATEDTATEDTATADEGTAEVADDPVTEEGSTPDASASAAFCEGFIGIEKAFMEAPEDESEIPAFVEERIQPNLDLIDGNEPTPIADAVRTLVSGVEEVTSTGDFSAFETPEFLAASEVVYSGLDDFCDVNVVEFNAVDHDYEHIPETLPAGDTSFVMSNDSATGEVHEFVLVKLSDETELSVEELLDMPEEEANEHIEIFAGGTYAPAGAASGMVSELTPGRWAYVCFIPVGSVDGAEGSGPPHFVEGMAGEFTVG